MPEGLGENKLEAIDTVTCALILKEENGRQMLLLVRRAKEKFAGYWSLSSGKGFLKPKHKLTPDQAVVKEVGADIGTQSFKGERKFNYTPKDRPDKEIIVYAGSVTESEIRVMPGQSDGFKWVTPEEAMQEKLAFEGNEIVERYFKKTKKLIVV